MSEPKTCPCGAMMWIADDAEWWPANANVDLYVVGKADSLFCPRCGAHLLPTGEVEPNRIAELEAELAQTKIELHDWENTHRSSDELCNELRKMADDLLKAREEYKDWPTCPQCNGRGVIEPAADGSADEQATE